MFHELPHLLTDASHWSFEVISDAVLAVPAYLVGRWRLRVHDRNAHPTTDKD